jgi:hypothetical protein
MTVPDGDVVQTVGVVFGTATGVDADVDFTTGAVALVCVAGAWTVVTLVWVAAPAGTVACAR